MWLSEASCMSLTASIRHPDFRYPDCYPDLVFQFVILFCFFDSQHSGKFKQNREKFSLRRLITT